MGSPLRQWIRWAIRNRIRTSGIQRPPCPEAGIELWLANSFIIVSVLDLEVGIGFVINPVHWVIHAENVLPLADDADHRLVSNLNKHPILTLIQAIKNLVRVILADYHAVLVHLGLEVNGV